MACNCNGKFIAYTYSSWMNTVPHYHIKVLHCEAFVPILYQREMYFFQSNDTVFLDIMWSTVYTNNQKLFETIWKYLMSSYTTVYEF